MLLYILMGRAGQDMKGIGRGDVAVAVSTASVTTKQKESILPLRTPGRSKS